MRLAARDAMHVLLLPKSSRTTFAVRRVTWCLSIKAMRAPDAGSSPARGPTMGQSNATSGRCSASPDHRLAAAEPVAISIGVCVTRFGGHTRASCFYWLWRKE